MAWLSLKIEAKENTADILSDTLIELGALSATIEDANAETSDEQAIFGEPGDPPPGIWRHNVVSALFDDAVIVSDIIQSLKQAIDQDDISYSTELIAEQDWVSATQSQFDPIRIRDDLWIVPSWHNAPHADAINIILDPGLAFGTGGHPTTHLCLAWLADNVKPEHSVLDYGCGSGILAIAAKKLGAAKVLGIDIDPLAIQSSTYNAEQNGISAEFYLADQISPNRLAQEPADIVIANILSSALMVLALMLAAACKPGGKIALSGILPEQIERLLENYSNWFDMALPLTMDNWVLLTGVKR